MGQDQSTLKGDLSPLEQRAKAISKAISKLKPTATRTDVPPPRVYTTQAPRDGNDPRLLLDAILYAEGPANLEIAVRNALNHRYITPYEVLRIIITETLEEDDEETIQRFALRYLDYQPIPDNVEKQAEKIARMIREEIDLPGNRLDMALQRWREILQIVDQLDGRSSARLQEARTKIHQFVENHGLNRVVDVLQAQHANEPGVSKALANIVGVRIRTMERTLYEDTRNRAANNIVIADNLFNWLTGQAELSFPRSNHAVGPSRAVWEPHFYGEDSTPEKSLQDVFRVTQRVRLPRWENIYLNALRHMDLFGIEVLLAQFLNTLSLAQQKVWMEKDVKELIEDSQRRRPVEMLAAIMADQLAADERRKRGIVPNYDWVPENIRLDYAAMARAAADELEVEEEAEEEIVVNNSPRRTRTGQTPPLNPSPTSADQDQLDQQLQVDQLEQQMQQDQPGNLDGLNNFDIFENLDDDIADPTTKAMYENLLTENIELLVDKEEQEAFIATLMEEMEEKQNQLDDKKQRESGRACLICGSYLIDEEEERTHMLTHRDEINAARKKDGLKPYGVDLGAAKRKGKGKVGSPGGKSNSSKTPKGKAKTSPTQHGGIRKTPRTPPNRTGFQGLGISSDSDEIFVTPPSRRRSPHADSPSRRKSPQKKVKFSGTYWPSNLPYKPPSPARMPVYKSTKGWWPTKESEKSASSASQSSSPASKLSSPRSLSALFGYHPTSPVQNLAETGYSPVSPFDFEPMSDLEYEPASATYNPRSPNDISGFFGQSPTSPAYDRTDPDYNPDLDSTSQDELEASSPSPQRKSRKSKSPSSGKSKSPSSRKTKSPSPPKSKKRKLSLSSREDGDEDDEQPVVPRKTPARAAKKTPAKVTKKTPAKVVKKTPSKPAKKTPRKAPPKATPKKATTPKTPAAPKKAQEERPSGLRKGDSAAFDKFFRERRGNPPKRK